MKTILLPTDFSENSWNAISYALHFFEKFTCNFYLLHVSKLIHASDGDMPYVPTQEIIDELYLKPARQKLQQVLKRISKQFPEQKNHNFYILTDYNFFIESIRRHVDEKKVDMIIMGTKGASGLQKFIIGSNAGDVITKVHCATLVVPENAKFTKLNEIAFPTDYTLTYNLQTLSPISEVLEAYNSAIRILHISKKDINLNVEQRKNKELLEDYFSNQTHSFHFLTNKKVEDAVQLFVESSKINMITMVAKNLNYFQQILFHTKIEEISYHTDIPFLVLHE